MKYLHLVWASLFRSRTRTFLTLLSVVTAFLLFGLLDSVRVAFNASSSVAGYDRMVVASRLSITQMLPVRLEEQIRQVDGVEDVVRAAWFGGVYRDQRSFFPNFSVGPGWFDVYSEYVISDEHVAAFEATRDGAVVGESLARQFGWEVGDVIPMQATIFPTQGSNDWQFKLVGTFKLADDKRKGEENALYFRWDYFNEANDFVKDRVGWWMVTLEDPSRADQVAQAIDKLSENSDHETKTQSEQAFNQSFIKQFADVGVIVTAIVGAVFGALNTMYAAVATRAREIATLRALGFRGVPVVVAVMLETMLLALLGGILGAALAWLVFNGYTAATLSGNFSQVMFEFQVGPELMWTGLKWALGIGLVGGLFPALRAARLPVTEALRAA